MRLLGCSCLFAAAFVASTDAQQSRSTAQPRDRGYDAYKVAMLTQPTGAEVARAAEFKLLGYIASKDRILREKPDATSAAVWTMHAFDVAAVFDVVPGWTKLASDDKRGWTNETGDVVKRSPKDASILLGLLDKISPHYPPTIELQILGRAVAIGFTQKQVKLALDEPLSTVEETTSTGTVKVLVYPGQRIELRADKVSKITTVR